jgi:hypothetical protein
MSKQVSMSTKSFSKLEVRPRRTSNLNSHHKQENKPVRRGSSTTSSSESAEGTRWTTVVEIFFTAFLDFFLLSSGDQKPLVPQHRKYLWKLFFSFC